MCDLFHDTLAPHLAAYVREAIINAFCHRDYRDPEEVRIVIFPDRVEVRNPGTLMEGLSLKTLKSGKVSRRRNPLIADLLRRIHLIEAWGRGIALIMEKAPDVSFTQVAGIFITEFPRPISPDEASSESVADGETRKKTREEILDLIQANPTVTAQELSQFLGISPKGIEWQIHRLKSEGQLMRISPAKGGHWQTIELGAAGERNP